jgi:hypothetical protein
MGCAGTGHLRLTPWASAHCADDMDGISALQFALAGSSVRVIGPSAILRDMDRILQHCPRARGLSDVTVCIEWDLGGWRIFSSTAGRERYLTAVPVPSVASAAVDVLVAETAMLNGLIVSRGVVLSKDGRGLIVRCVDGDAEIVAMHLSARHWRLLSVNHALIDTHTMIAASIRRNFALSSAQVASIPLSWKHAVEVSPWYSARDGVYFYSIDPEHICGTATWAPDTSCAGLLDIDGEVAEESSVRSLAADADLGELANAPLIKGRLVLSRAVNACNAIENWWERDVAGV